MEENNKYETKENGSGSALYGTEPQPQEDKNTYSSVYGTKLEPQETETPVQQTKPEITQEIEPLSPPESVTESTKTQAIQEMEPSLATVSLTKPIESETVQEPVSSQPVQLTKPMESGSVQESVQPQQQTFQQQGFTGGDAMGFGPMQAPPPVQGAPASKPKKKKTGLIAGILCAAAVVIVIGVGVLLAKSLFGDNAKNQLAKGLANMAKEMAAYQNSVAEDIGLVALNKQKKERKTNQSTKQQTKPSCIH